jgi:hypothetical protein
MQSTASSPQEYISSLPDERKKTIEKLRAVILKNLPKGFEEGIAHGMIGYVVPLSLYPKGYHVNPKNPLLLFSLASEKNYISLHHMALYTGPILEWFTAEWKKSTPKKLDMGKSCIRFKKPEEIPYELIGRLVSKLTPEQWIAAYEKALERLPQKKPK